MTILHPQHGGHPNAPEAAGTPWTEPASAMGPGGGDGDWDRFAGVRIPQKDPFAQSAANQVAAQAGHNARHLDVVASAVDAAIAARSTTDWTRKKLGEVIRAVRAGYGQGRGDNYRPWLRIRRNFSSPVSHQIAESVGINARNHHLLSKLEYKAALFTAYLGVSHELREGLPMWPFDHPHPTADLGSTRVQPAYMPGLLTVARDLGVEHGHYIGSKVPYVGTIDLVHTLVRDGKEVLLGVSCKPRALIDASARNRERLALDERYCALAGAHHATEDGVDLDTVAFKTLYRQLRDFKPFTSEIRAHRATQRLADFAGYFDALADTIPLSNAALQAGGRVGLGAAESFQFFRIAIWLHLVDIDLAQPMQMTAPIRRGAQAVLSMLRLRYLGGHHD